LDLAASLRKLVIGVYRLNPLKKREGMNRNINGLELMHQVCMLFHASNDPISKHPAVDYLCQKFQSNGVEILSETEREVIPEDKEIALYEEDTIIIQIPVCQDCLDALASFKWVLLFCLNCNRSGWLQRVHTESYLGTDPVKWLTRCPGCSPNKE
jgi:hypothetical protein